MKTSLTQMKILSSKVFRELTKVHKALIIGCASFVVFATLANLFAVVFQARLLDEFRQNSGNIEKVFWAYLALQLLAEFLSLCRRSLQNRISMRTGTLLRNQIYKKVMSMGSLKVEQIGSGDIVQKMTADATQVAAVWSEGLLAFFMTLITALGVTLFLMLDIGPLGSVFLFLLFIIVGSAAYFSKVSAPHIQKRVRASAKRLGEIQFAVEGIKTLKMLVLEPFALKKIQSSSALEREARLDFNELGCKFVPIFASIRWVGWFILLAGAIFKGDLLGEGFVGHSLVATVFAIYWYSNLLQEVFLFIGAYLNVVQIADVSLARIDDFLATPSLRHIPNEPEDSANYAEFRDASFVYPSRSGVVALMLKQLEIKKGEFVALVGPLGSGKTTAIRALLGELPPATGEVKVQGGGTALVTQEAPLFAATVRDTLRLAFDNDPSEDEHLLKILELSEFTHDLKALPAGLDTRVGERGQTLSGGQRGRLNLARAQYFSSTNTLILDDPFSALDRATAKRVAHALLDGAWQGKTRIVATHRLEIVKGAHRIVVFSEGRVLGVGSHEELLGHCEPYREMVRSYQENTVHGNP